jgi:ATP-dependent Clp protease adaptor protein ClpS
MCPGGQKIKKALPSMFSIVVVILVKVIPGMTIKKATKIMYEVYSKGQAVVKQCHEELAELYEERLLEKGLTASIEPPR